MSFSFTKEQHAELLAAIHAAVELMNNANLTNSDYTPEPFLFRLDESHRQLFVALLQQDVNYLLTDLDRESRQSKARGRPRQHAIRLFVRAVAAHIEAFGLRLAVTHMPRGRGGLLAKTVRICLQAIGRTAPDDPYRLLKSAIGCPKTLTEVETVDEEHIENTHYHPCRDQLHRHRTPKGAERCGSHTREFDVTSDLRARNPARSRKR